MKKVNWKSGQRVIKQILDWFQDAKDSSILERQDDYTDYGILKNDLNEFDIIVGGNNTVFTPSITVRTGVAFDVNLERIIISDEAVSYDSANTTHTTDDGSGTLISTPRSTGSLNIPLTVNVDNFVWIDYLQTIDDSVFTLHKLTNLKQFYKKTDGYTITITLVDTPPTVNSLKLGHVDLTAGGVVSSTTIVKTGRVLGGLSHYRAKAHTVLADKSDRNTVYTPDQEIFVDDHIRTIGTGIVSAVNPHGLAPTDIGLSAASTVQEHQEFFHSNGIIGDETLTTSVLFPFVTTVDPGFDFVTFRALVGTERVHVNGNVILAEDISSDVDVLFSASDPSGTWYMYLDGSTKTILKTQTNLIATPDNTKFVLASVFWTYPGNEGAGDGDITALIDYRLFGTIGTRDIHNDAITRPKILNNAVNEFKIDPSVAGNGLSGGNGTPLSVNVFSGIDITGDTLRLAPTSAGNGLSYTTGVLDVNVSTGLEIVSDSLRISSAAAGSGLGWSGGILSVNVDSTSIEITSDTLRIASGAAGNGLGYSAGVLSVNVDNSTIEINSDTLRVKASGITGTQLATSVAGAGLAGGGGSALSVNVDGTYIVISGDTVSASNLIKPTHYIRDIGPFNQIGSIPSIQVNGGGAAYTQVYSYSGHGALKGVTFFTNNVGSGGASFDFKVVIDGNAYEILDARSGVNGGQGWGTLNNYATVANAINSANAIGWVSGTDTHSQFYFGFTTGFQLYLRGRAFSDGRWGYTPYVSYETV